MLPPQRSLTAFWLASSHLFSSQHQWFLVYYCIISFLSVSFLECKTVRERRLPGLLTTCPWKNADALITSRPLLVNQWTCILRSKWLFFNYSASLLTSKGTHWYRGKFPNSFWKVLLFGYCYDDQSQGTGVLRAPDLGSFPNPLYATSLYNKCLINELIRCKMQSTSFFLFLVSYFLYLLFYCCAGGSLWHLQKFL
jgi:hypothetical protein